MPFPATHPALERALAARGYAEPTPVQSAVLEGAAVDADLLVSAQTGSGKTVAFGLALAETLLGAAERFDRAGAPLALVVAPTRELALQVAKELTWLYAEAGARVVECVGGMDARREQRLLEAGAHIVVGTPGRLKDHIQRGNLDLSGLAAVVLDEADEMLDLGFKDDLEFILGEAPPERRTLLFSATIAKDIAALAKQYQRDAIRLDTTNKNVPHGDIEYQAMRVAPHDVEHAVTNVLRFFEAPGALVFCGTREKVRHLHASLRERGFAVVGLSGELSQRERADALQALRDGRARVCVATDVAARGLDLPDLGLVIHADLPVNKASLLHRSGRTGRAGRKGVSVLLVTHTRRRKAELMLRDAAIEATWSGAPTADEIRAKDQARLLNAPLLIEPADEDELTMARQLLEARGAEEIAVAWLRRQRENMPAPEELQDDLRMRDAQTREKSWKPDGPRGERPDRDGPRERPVRDGRAFTNDTVWFRASVGRKHNADPKWLLPMICKVGGVSRDDIGAIRIFDSETKFEIIAASADKFTAAAVADTTEKVRIEVSTAPSESDIVERPARKPFAKKPFKSRDNGDGPRPDFKPRDGGGDRPAWKRDDASGEKPAWKRDEAAAGKPAWKAKPEGDAPRREFKPREDGPAKPAWSREAGAEGGAKPAWKDRPAPSADSPRPAYKPREDRPAKPGWAARKADGDGAKPAWKGKPKGDFKPKAGFKGKSDFKPKGPRKPA